MSSKQATAAAEPKLEKVLLIAPHTHAGKPCKAGDSIDVSEAEKNWLIRHNKVAGPAAATSAAPAAKE